MERLYQTNARIATMPHRNFSKTILKQLDSKIKLVSLRAPLLPPHQSKRWRRLLQRPPKPALLRGSTSCAGQTASYSSMGSELPMMTSRRLLVVLNVSSRGKMTRRKSCNSTWNCSQLHFSPCSFGSLMLSMMCQDGGEWASADGNCLSGWKFAWRILSAEGGV